MILSYAGPLYPLEERPEKFSKWFIKVKQKHKLKKGRSLICDIM